MNTHLTRRHFLGTAISGAAALLNENPLHAAEVDPRVRGPFPILSTPFTETGAVDYEVLANEARFVDWGGCPGMIWPQSGDSVDLLTMDEKLRGMEVLAETSRSFKTSALCLGVQGRDTEEMLVYARHAEKLAPAAIISRPPDSGRTEDDLRQYWRELAKVAKRPVIIQTTGGVAYKGPVPSVKLLIELAEEFPHFGYIKEEAAPVIARTRELILAQLSPRYAADVTIGEASAGGARVAVVTIQAPDDEPDGPVASEPEDDLRDIEWWEEFDDAAW